MKNNIIQVIKILCFFIILFSTYQYLTYLKKPLDSSLDNIAGFYAEEKNSLDAIYIGGSACFVYWEPLKAWEDKGITSYNFAANTIQPELYEYLIKETLKYQNPSVIIIDARAFQYRDEDQPPTEVAYRNFLAGTPSSLYKYSFIEDNVPKFLGESTLSYHFDLIKYHSSKDYNTFEDILKLITNKYSNKLKGFYFVPKQAKIDQYDFYNETEVALSGETTDILDSLLKYLNTLDKKVLFVVSPYSETYEQKQSFNFVERKVVEAGFDFIDTNEYYNEMGIDFAIDFYNLNHVNIYGSEKYTEFLENYLVSNYSLPDRRLDERYKNKWNDLLNNWHGEVESTKEIIESL